MRVANLRVVVSICVAMFVGFLGGDSAYRLDSSYNRGKQPRRISVKPTSDLRMFKVRTGWRKNHITYYFVNYSPDISRNEQRKIFQQAFSIWAEVSNLNFSEVTNVSYADIVIGFGSGNHCELYEINGEACRNNPFDGEGNIVAHCYFPPAHGNIAGLGKRYTGDCHFDEDEQWVSEWGTQGTRLLETAIHELGHSLGIEHSEIEATIMFPTYRTGNIKVLLQENDINAVQKLYGSPKGRVRGRTQIQVRKPLSSERPRGKPVVIGL